MRTIAAFAGVKRRFEYIVKTSQLVYIDDPLLIAEHGSDFR